MTKEEMAALRDIRGYAAANRITTGQHARLRMRERGVLYNDLRCALLGAHRCIRGEERRWEVEGNDEDGVGLRLIVILEDGVVVITLMDTRDP